MATTITKTEKLVGKRIRRHEDPRLITGTATYVDDIKMPGMHHAVHRAQPARRGATSSPSTFRRPPRSPASRRSSPAKTSRTSARCVCGADPARSAHAASPHPGAWTASTSSAIPSPSWSPPTATSRPTPPISSKSITRSRRPSPIPKRPSPPGAPAVHPEWPDNIAFNFHQEGGDIDKAFRRSRRGREAAHHQPAPGSQRHGNARRGGRVAAGATAR